MSLRRRERQLRRYIAVVQDARGYPSAGDLENAPPDGPEQPMLYTVVKADEHEAELAATAEERDAYRFALEQIEGSPRAGIGCDQQVIARAALNQYRESGLAS